jgi:hypothetical protein
VIGGNVKNIEFLGRFKTTFLKFRGLGKLTEILCENQMVINHVDGRDNTP